MLRAGIGHWYCSEVSEQPKKIVVEVISVEIDGEDGGGDVMLRVETVDLAIFGAIIGHDVELVVEFDEPQRKKRAKVLKIVDTTGFEGE